MENNKNNRSSGASSNINELIDSLQKQGYQVVDLNGCESLMDMLERIAESNARPSKGSGISSKDGFSLDCANCEKASHCVDENIIRAITHNPSLMDKLDKLGDYVDLLAHLIIVNMDISGRTMVNSLIKAMRLAFYNGMSVGTTGRMYKEDATEETIQAFSDRIEKIINERTR